MALAAAIAVLHAQHRSEMLKHQLATLQTEQADREQAVARRPQPRPHYAADAAAVVATQAVPIDAALSAIEHTYVQGVLVQALELTPAARAITLRLEFGAPDLALSYVVLLNQHDARINWSIESIEMGAGDASSRPIATVKGVFRD
ncbi:hypothetical protein IP84_06980 [beta proteobacterium AAP99]|nr:hypothetical protein IP84_06980 [beta proteobacterium AAP99]